MTRAQKYREEGKEEPKVRPKRKKQPGGVFGELYYQARLK